MFLLSISDINDGTSKEFSFSVYVSVIRRMEVGRYKVTGLIYLPVYMDALARLYFLSATKIIGKKNRKT